MTSSSSSSNNTSNSSSSSSSSRLFSSSKCTTSKVSGPVCAGSNLVGIWWSVWLGLRVGVPSTPPAVGSLLSET